MYLIFANTASLSIDHEYATDYLQKSIYQNLLYTLSSTSLRLTCFSINLVLVAAVSNSVATVYGKFGTNYMYLELLLT